MDFTARKLLASLAALLALAGCASESGSPGDDDNGGGSRRPGEPSSIDVQRGVVLASLMRADSCTDLLSQIQDDVAAKVELQAEQLKRGEQYAYPGRGTGGLSGGLDNGGGFENPGGEAPPSASAGNGGAGGAAGTGASGMGSGGSPAIPGDGDGDSSGEGPGEGPSDYSDTNTQVAGVDEADIVKTDGDRIYLAHGNELFVLKSWPASESSIESSIKIEGQVQELFVHEGKAAVFSYLYDQGDLIAPRPTDAAGDAAYYPGYYYGTTFTKITVIDLAQEAPDVERELIIEGSYLSSRRHGKTVRVVLQGGFRTPPVYDANIQYRDPWGRQYAQEDIDAQVDAWRDRVIAGVRMTTIDDWLPAEREVIDGVLTPPDRRCTDFYAPPPALTSYGLTNVVSFDMLDPTGALGGAIVLGSADEVYSNSDVLLLSQRDYRWDSRLAERSRTILHLFDLSESETSYAASGFAPGHILDQFSLDERDGIVRLTTTTQAWNEWSSEIVEPAQDDPWVDIAEQRTTDNRVIALEVKDGKLERAGVSAPLGEEGETIFSTRFVGDRAYVVTFRQTDPLLVVDTSDPKKLRLLGELHIPGFSDYMHPVDAGHLLTIGRDADESGFQRGLLLQIFDVTNPTNPVLAHREAYTQDGWSEANSNHKAFTYFDPGDDSPYAGLLAFPFVSYSYNTSSLEVFEVSVDEGFSKLGAIDHTALVTSCLTERYGTAPGDIYYDPYYCAPEVKRGMFVTGNEGDEYVYSIGSGGVLVHQLPELATPVATVRLPQADHDEHRVYYGGGATPAPGTGGAAGGIAGTGAGAFGGAGGTAGAAGMSSGGT